MRTKYIFVKLSLQNIAFRRKESNQRGQRPLSRPLPLLRPGSPVTDVLVLALDDEHVALDVHLKNRVFSVRVVSESSRRVKTHGKLLRLELVCIDVHGESSIVVDDVGVNVETLL